MRQPPLATISIVEDDWQLVADESSTELMARAQAVGSWQRVAQESVEGGLKVLILAFTLRVSTSGRFTCARFAHKHRQCISFEFFAPSCKAGIRVQCEYVARVGALPVR